MDLKNAAAVCLISLFSATIVVLIARALDSQAASQLEPQLTAIAEELQAIRKQADLPPRPAMRPVETVDDGLVVYYFHNNFPLRKLPGHRSATKETLDADFSPQLSNGEIVWKTLNFQKPAGMRLADKFKCQGPPSSSWQE